MMYHHKKKEGRGGRKGKWMHVSRCMHCISSSDEGLCMECDDG
jgi:hypothetical protein